MSNWFYHLIDDLNTYDKQDEMKELYSRMYLAKDSHKELKKWCREMLDLANIPVGSFRTEFIRELFKPGSNEPELLLEHIYDVCDTEPPLSDEEDEDDEEDQEEGDMRKREDAVEEATCVVCSETKTEDWAWNTTPVKNAPVCGDCLDSK